MRVPLDNEVVLVNMLKFLSMKDRNSLKLVSKSVNKSFRYALLTSQSVKILLNTEHVWNDDISMMLNSFGKSNAHLAAELSKVDPQRMMILTQLLESMPVLHGRITDFIMHDGGRYLALNQFELRLLFRLPFLNRLEKLQITIRQPISIALFSGTRFPLLKQLFITRGVYNSNYELSPTDFKGLVEADMPCLEELYLCRFQDRYITADAYDNLCESTWPLKSLELVGMGIQRGMFANLSSAPWAGGLQEFCMSNTEENDGDEEDEVFFLDEWPKLKLPSLTKCTLVSIWQFSEFHKASLPRLQSLTLNNISVYPEILENLGARYPELEEMTLVQPHPSEEYVAILQHMEAPKKLKALSLSGFFTEESALKLLLKNQKLREQLEVLQLHDTKTAPGRQKLGQGTLFKTGRIVSVYESAFDPHVKLLLASEWPKLKQLRFHSREILEKVEEVRREVSQYLFCGYLRGCFVKGNFPVLEEVSFASYSTEKEMEEISIDTYVF